MNRKIIVVFLAISLISTSFLLFVPTLTSMNLINTNASKQYDVSISAENDQTVSFTCEKDESLINKNSMDDIKLTIGDWKITNTYLRFSDIHAPLFEKKVEGTGTITNLDVKNYPVAMKIEVSSNTMVQDFSALMQFSGISNTITSRLMVLIYNSTWTGTYSEPFSFGDFIYMEEFNHVSELGLPEGASGPILVNFSLSSAVPLNIIETENNTFYIALYHSSGLGNSFWDGYRGSSSTDFSYFFGSSWTRTANLAGYDRIFTTVVNLQDYTPLPEEINMQVNSLNVNDLSIASGDVTLVGDYEGPEVIYDVTAKSTIEFTVEYDCDFEKEIVITPTSEDLSNGDTKWMLSFDGNFITDSHNNEMRVTLAEDWTSTKVYKDSVEYSDITIDYTNDNVLIHNIDVDGSWDVTSLVDNPDPEPEPPKPKPWWWRFFWCIIRIFFWWCR